MIVGIWQMGFSENAAVKGASPSTDVVDCINKFISTGNQTALYPLQVLYMINATVIQGSRVQDFSIGLNQGFAVTLAAHLICHHALSLDDYDVPDMWQEEHMKELAERLRQCLTMHGTYEPAPDVEAQVFKAISSKKQAWSAPAREFCSTLKWPVQAISWLQHLFSRAPPSTFSRSCFESLAELLRASAGSTAPATQPPPIGFCFRQGCGVQGSHVTEDGTRDFERSD